MRIPKSFGARRCLLRLLLFTISLFVMSCTAGETKTEMPIISLGTPDIQALLQGDKVKLTWKNKEGDHSYRVIYGAVGSRPLDFSTTKTEAVIEGLDTSKVYLIQVEAYQGKYQSYFLQALEINLPQITGRIKLN